MLPRTTSRRLGLTANIVPVIMKELSPLFSCAEEMHTVPIAISHQQAQESLASHVGAQSLSLAAPHDLQGWLHGRPAVVPCAVVTAGGDFFTVAGRPSADSWCSRPGERLPGGRQGTLLTPHQVAAQEAQARPPGVAVVRTAMHHKMWPCWGSRWLGSLNRSLRHAATVYSRIRGWKPNCI